MEFPLKSIVYTGCLVFLWAASPALCQAELKPEEVAIIGARGSRNSEALAKYYAEVRGIPTENILLITVPAGETLDHDKWRWAIRPEIRKWLLEGDRADRIRCLTTLWDVPLKISRGPADENLQAYQRFLEGERTTRLKLLEDSIAAADALAANFAATSDEASDASDDAEVERSELEQLKAKIEKSMRAAQARIVQRPAGDERNRDLSQLQNLFTMAGGISVLNNSLAQQLQNTPDGNQALQTQVDQLNGRIMAYAEVRSLLEQMAYGVERDALILFLLSRSNGVLGSVEWLDQEIQTVDKNETHASFDSELSLILWPDDYQLLRYQPNYLRAAYDNSELRQTHPTMMVARLDAPTVALAKGLVDTAIKVEQEGLKGKIYLDSRGIGSLDQPTVAQGSYADFDRAVLLAAENLRQNSDMEVVLEETQTLFQEGDCPDAALYCGWYSLGKYVDAFDWAPGAVAYHMASAEARTLRDENSQVWCKRMLEEGVAATIGPVYEPYLIAFPRPNEFFDLLIQGDLTLVECYYRTKPYNSWMMTLIGDPLYRPFAQK